jgi:excisionase family DNA binding protein
MTSREYSMGRLSISEAARQTGISRQHFYKLVKDGKVTTERDEDGNPYVDEAELKRAFGGRLPKVKPPTTPHDKVTVSDGRQHTPVYDSIIVGLQKEVELLREQLQKAEYREAELHRHIERLTTQQPQVEKRGIFQRLLGWGGTPSTSKS